MTGDPGNDLQRHKAASLRPESGREESIGRGMAAAVDIETSKLINLSRLTPPILNITHSRRGRATKTKRQASGGAVMLLR